MQPRMSDLPAIFSTQDLHDDDGTVIDSLFLEVDAPPDVKEAVQQGQPGQETPVKPAPLKTRLLTGTTTINGGAQQFSLVPEDVNRKSLQILITGTNTAVTFNDYLIFGTDGAVTSAGPTTSMGLLRVRPQPAFVATVVLLTEHTGAVWVVPGPIVNAIEVTWVAVTI